MSFATTQPQNTRVVTVAEALQIAANAFNSGRVEESASISRQLLELDKSNGQARNILRQSQQRLFDLHGNGAYVQGSCGLERFVFSDETGRLTDDEYQLALAQIKHTVDSMQERDRSSSNNPNIAGESIWVPGGNDRWQIDKGPTDYYVLSKLVMSGDREILQKLRLYSPFTGYVLPTLSVSEARPWVSEKLPTNWDACLKLIVPRSDFGFVRYMIVHSHAPKHLPQSLPPKFGEIGWLVDGGIANFDTAYYLDKLVQMDETKILDRLSGGDTRSVVEIGGGFGGMAYMLQAALKNLRYIIVDLPEMLVFSAIYLSVLFPSLKNRYVTKSEEMVIDNEPGFTFVPAYLHRELRGRLSCSLAVNTASFAEMGETQVRDYGETLANILGGDGLLWEQKPRTGGSAL